jgi:hypothetical protein
MLGKAGRWRTPARRRHPPQDAGEQPLGIRMARPAEEIPDRGRSMICQRTSPPRWQTSLTTPRSCVIRSSEAPTA